MDDAWTGFLRFSDAIGRLSDGMWGGMRRPDPVQTIKQSHKKLSVGFGLWRQKAGCRLRTAAVKGELVVYVLAEPQVRSKKRTLTERAPEKIEPAVVPVNVLKRLIPSRGALPDRAIRPSIKTAEGNEKLFALLAVGSLIVRASDFDIWYRAERAKGKWSSQRAKSNVGGGRPTLQTEALSSAVLALVNDLKWSGKDGIAKLRGLLVASGRSAVPSPDTLARMVDRLHRETGQAANQAHAAQAGLGRKQPPLPQNLI